MSGNRTPGRPGKPQNQSSEPESIRDARMNDDLSTGIPQNPNQVISVERGVLLRIESAALMIGIGRTKMYELIRRREIPVVRIGRRTLVHRDDLEHFAQALRSG